MNSSILPVLAASVLAGSAQATLVAAWDFQTTTTGGTAAVASAASGAANTTPKVYVANFGSGTIYLDGSNGSSNWYVPALGGSNAEINAFGGTTVNADASIGMSTATSGAAALALAGGLRSGTVGNYSYAANGKSMVFKFSMTGLAGLSISYATQRTSTGFTSQVLEYSTNGTSWSSIGSNTSIQSSYSGTATPPGVATSFSGINGLDGASVAYVRVTFTGATDASGNNRIDNIQFHANTVPAPGALALLGVAGLVGARRRR